MGNLSISRHWESAAHDVPEVRFTSAILKIVLGNEVITRNEDEWSQTVRDDVRLSAYPLALWFASSWWRLRWEPLPVSPPDSAWRMAHEVAAAGYGYLWPKMLLASDGESVHVWAVQSHPTTKEPVRYLSSAYDSLTGREFERTIDDFVTSVLSRLDAVGVRDTDLHGLWKELLDERADKSLSVYRRIEAVLGFDPDAAPADAIDRFEALIPAVGESAVAEIAPICAVKNPRAELERIVAFVDSAGLNGHIDLAVAHRDKSHVPVWHTGRELARAARDALKLNGGPVNDARLSELVGLPQKAAMDLAVPKGAPLGVAVRRPGKGKLKFHLRKRNKPGRRFEIARVLGDYLSAATADNWFPVTDAHTARQRLQRSFAAEFLCPIDAIKEDLANDFSDDAIEDVAEKFGVSPVAVQTQLVNNHLLPASVLDQYAAGFEFPYLHVKSGAEPPAAIAH